MNIISRTITGTIAVLSGFFLMIRGLFGDPWASVYGIGVTIIGVFIFLNKKEDDIEEIKGRKN